jgi:Type VI secretion system/phage-baseplate injector OB domain
VTDVADPLALGRVRAVCPDISGRDPLPDWLWPLGTVGGGAAGRGLFAVPPKGAAIGILFAAGNEQNGFYLAGWWGEPTAGAKETPDPGTTGTKGDAGTTLWETAKWRVILSDTANTLRIESKGTPGTYVQIDGASGEMQLVTTDLKLGSGSATEALVLGTAFLALFNAHTHSGVTVGGGVTGAPVTPMVPGTHTSTIAKTV